MSHPENPKNLEEVERPETKLRRHFTISKELFEVGYILDELPTGTVSRYICEAILHYNQVKNNPDWMMERLERMAILHAQIKNTDDTHNLLVDVPTSPVKQGVEAVGEPENAPLPREVLSAETEYVMEAEPEVAKEVETPIVNDPPQTPKNSPTPPVSVPKPQGGLMRRRR